MGKSVFSKNKKWRYIEDKLENGVEPLLLIEEYGLAAVIMLDPAKRDCRYGVQYQIEPINSPHGQPSLFGFHWSHPFGECPHGLTMAEVVETAKERCIIDMMNIAAWKKSNE